MEINKKLYKKSNNYKKNTLSVCLHKIIDAMNGVVVVCVRRGQTLYWPIVCDTCLWCTSSTTSFSTSMSCLRSSSKSNGSMCCCDSCLGFSLASECRDSGRHRWDCWTICSSVGALRLQAWTRWMCWRQWWSSRWAASCGPYLWARDVAANGSSPLTATVRPLPGLRWPPLATHPYTRPHSSPLGTRCHT